jgi:hypothetical protein
MDPVKMIIAWMLCFIAACIALPASESVSVSRVAASNRISQRVVHPIYNHESDSFEKHPAYLVNKQIQYSALPYPIRSNVSAPNYTRTQHFQNPQAYDSAPVATNNHYPLRNELVTYQPNGNHLLTEE